MVRAITGDYKISYYVKGPEHPPVIVDFTPPFRRISLCDGLQAAIRLSERTNVHVSPDIASKGV